jgi:integrase
MPERRKYDEGSIVQIGENKYRLFVSDGKGADKKRKRPSRTVEAKDEAQALALLKKFKKEVERDGLPAPRNMTFAQLWNTYISDYVEVNDAPKTLEWYQERGKRLLSYFGSMRVSNISEVDIGAFYKLLLDPNKFIEYRIKSDKPGEPDKVKKLKGGLARNSILHYQRVLNAVFNYAIEILKVIKDNPAANVKVPKNRHAPKKPPNRFADTDMPAFLEALVREPLKWQAAFLLGLTAAHRREEVAGIKWLDFNFSRNTIKISRAVQYIARQGLIIGDTKTEESARESFLPDVTIMVCSAWKEEQRRSLQLRIKKLKEIKVVDRAILMEIEKLNRRLNNFEDEFVFNQRDGSPIMPDSITTHMSRFIKKNGLPHVTFHGLKHTSATLSIAAGADIKAVAKRLGHTDAKMTLNTYADALESSDKKIAKRWDKIINYERWHGNGTISESSKNPEK